MIQNHISKYSISYGKMSSLYYTEGDYMDQNIKLEPKKNSKTGGFFKSFVNVRAWVSYDEIKNNTKSIYGLFIRFFSNKTNKVIHEETFEEAILRLNLTEKQMNDRKKIFLYSALIYLCVALLLMAYALHLFTNSHALLAIFTLTLTTFVTTLAYREHLWYMQISKRKLGCNFSEWLKFMFEK